MRIFMARTDAPESVRLSLPDARLLSISRTGEMAVSLHHTFEGWMGFGTLARSSVLGSAPRVLAENIREAEWTPRRASWPWSAASNGLEQLEFPMGHVVYRTSGSSAISASHHPAIASPLPTTPCLPTTPAVCRWWIARARAPSWRMDSFQLRGVAWSPNGEEVWFTGHPCGAGRDVRDAIFAVTLDGRRRVALVGPDLPEALRRRA